MDYFEKAKRRVLASRPKFEGTDYPYFEVVGAAKVTRVNEAIKAAGIEHQVTSVTLNPDGRYEMTITGS